MSGDLWVSFPQPCEESWQGMQPKGCNRYCAACDEIVHDLSEMTVEQAEALLGSGMKSCVRAAIQADGSIAHKSSSSSRKLMFAAGVSLAVGACQSAPISPRSVVSGSVYSSYSIPDIRLKAADGRTYRASRTKDGRFAIPNLDPGAYILTMTDCNGKRKKAVDVTVGSEDVDIGMVVLKPDEDEECPIVVGLMVRIDHQHG